jgi:hypothetical protein
MGVARGVRANGLVGGLGDLEMSVGGHLHPPLVCGCARFDDAPNRMLT